MGIKCIKGSWRRCHLRIKYVCKRTDHIKGKRLLNSVALIDVTNKKLGEAADGMGARVGTCLINRWKVRIDGKSLYNVKADAPKKEDN